jgi:zinc finger CCHC domain-containing protein 9
MAPEQPSNAATKHKKSNDEKANKKKRKAEGDAAATDFKPAKSSNSGKAKRIRHRKPDSSAQPKDTIQPSSLDKPIKIRSANAKKKRREKLKLLALHCFHCRLQGHAVKDCPSLASGTSSSAGSCWRCGSVSHTVKKCEEKEDPSRPYPFALCGVCGELGHIAGACEKNEKGFFPGGGGCRFCGSNRHFATKCPEKHKGKTVVVEGAEEGQTGAVEEYLSDEELVKTKKEGKLGKEGKEGKGAKD